MKPGFLLALLGLLVLQACGAPGRRSSADLAAIAPAPQRWLATDGSVPVQRLWWQGFGDPVLARLVLHGDPFTLWSVGGSVLAPLFNGGRLRSLADASASRRDQALISYERSVLTAFAEVETQLSAYAFQREQLAQAQAQRVALEDALRIAGRRYREGFASYLDELLAQRNLFAVEQNVLQLQADLLAIEVNLYRALGGGWTPEDHATPPR